MWPVLPVEEIVKTIKVKVDNRIILELIITLKIMIRKD